MDGTRLVADCDSDVNAAAGVDPSTDSSKSGVRRTDAISLFCFECGAALATVVGVLIEVPVMLLVVRLVSQSKGWYESGAKA